MLLKSVKIGQLVRFDAVMAESFEGIVIDVDNFLVTVKKSTGGVKQVHFSGLKLIRPAKSENKNPTILDLTRRVKELEFRLSKYEPINSRF